MIGDLVFMISGHSWSDRLVCWLWDTYQPAMAESEVVIWKIDDVSGIDNGNVQSIN